MPYYVEAIAALFFIKRVLNRCSTFAIFASRVLAVSRDRDSDMLQHNNKNRHTRLASQ